MEKVKITKKQAKSIEKYKDSAKANHEKYKNNHKCNLPDWSYTLLELSTSDFIDALFEGYEVEKEFKEGDWVHYDNGIKSTPRFVTRLISKVYAESVDLGDNRTMPIDDIRHATDEEIATEKQRRFWNGNDRDVEELSKNDIVSYANYSGGGIFIVTSYVFEDNDKRRVVQIYNRHSQAYMTRAVSELKVMCFAEKRKDIN